MRSGNRSGFYFVNGGLENLEWLHPLSIDCREFKHHVPSFGEIGTFNKYLP